MRTKRTLVNTAYTLGSYAILFALGLITRSLFISRFGDVIPGYSGLIESIFSFFNLTELGVGSVISYRLYETIAQKDAEQVSKYMSLYKTAYRIIGLVIVTLAVIVYLFFLPLIITEPDTDWTAVRVIYFLQIASIITSYFLVTRRLMYTCTQRGYICTRIDLGVNVANGLTRIAIALWMPNYVLWFAVVFGYNTLANILVALQYHKDFPELHDVKVGWRDFKDLGIFHDLRYYLVHRVSNAIYGSSDNLVVTRMQGVASVTLLTNYSTLSGKVTELFNKLLDAFSAAIGNIVYDQDASADGHAKQVFWSMDLFSYFVGSFVAVAYFCCLQPFIEWWIGGRYLLPMLYVFAFCLNEYVGWNHRMLGSYRAVLGRFEEDQWFMIASGVGNLVLSFALIRPLGLAGVVFATVAAHCMMWIGRARVVFRHYMKGCGWRYFGVQALRFAVLLGEMWLCLTLCTTLFGNAPTLINVFLRAILVCILPNGINLLLFGFTSDAAYLRGKAAGVYRKLKAKRQQGGDGQ